MLKGLLSGLFDGDGTVSKKGSISMGFKNTEENVKYFKEVQTLLLLFGVRSRIFTDKLVRIFIMKWDNLIFKQYIGFKNNKKQNRIIATKNVKPKVGKTLTVKKVLYTGRYEDMYDVINMPTKKFMANGIITHNCSGGTNHILEMAMIKLKNTFPDLDIIVPIHDALVFEIPEKRVTHSDITDHIKCCMENVAKLSVPIVCNIKVGENLGCMSEVK